MITIAIVTRNAMHGGVETMLAIHQKYLGATIFVAGGSNLSETCPFTYHYIDATHSAQAQEHLTKRLRAYDVIMYHWLPDWALEAIRAAHKPCIEVVHRTDTSENDKSIPTVLVTHSEFIAHYLRRVYERDAIVIPHGIDLCRFPQATQGQYIGAITSYYLTKGIDIFLYAWARIHEKYPHHKVRFYGYGSDQTNFEALASALNLNNVEFLGPTASPELHLGEFRIFIQPSRVEGMPFAIMEALACNIPVICSDLPGMAELNRHAQEHGYEPPLILAKTEDPDDLAEKIEYVLENPTATYNSRLYIERYYSPEVHCQRYWSAIGKAIREFDRYGLRDIPNT